MKESLAEIVQLRHDERGLWRASNKELNIIVHDNTPMLATDKFLRAKKRQEAAIALRTPRQ